MYPVQEIAEYIIWVSDRNDCNISNLKLQKILYFVQAEFLVTTGQPCFNEAIEAWSFGPVVPEIYHRYKVSGNAPIFCVNKENDSCIDRRDKFLIDGIIQECSEYTAPQLVNITTHQTPWIEAYRPHLKCEITKDSIAKFFF